MDTGGQSAVTHGLKDACRADRPKTGSEYTLSENSLRFGIITLFTELLLLLHGRYGKPLGPVTHELL